MRKATQSPLVEGGAGNQGMKIRTADMEIHYFLKDGTLWRDAGNQKPMALLRGIAASDFDRDAREFVTGWKWNLELKRKAGESRMRPLFTFTAAPEKGAAK